MALTVCTEAQKALDLASMIMVGSNNELFSCVYCLFTASIMLKLSRTLPIVQALVQQNFLVI